MTMKFLAILSALTASAAATVIMPRQDWGYAPNPGNASISILQPTYLQNVGSPGDTFSIILSEEYVCLVPFSMQCTVLICFS